MLDQVVTLRLPVITADNLVAVSLEVGRQPTVIKDTEATDKHRLTGSSSGNYLFFSYLTVKTNRKFCF